MHGGPPVGDHYAASEAEIEGIMTQYVVGASGITGSSLEQLLVMLGGEGSLVATVTGLIAGNRFVPITGISFGLTVSFGLEKSWRADDIREIRRDTDANSECSINAAGKRIGLE